MNDGGRARSISSGADPALRDVGLVISLLCLLVACCGCGHSRVLGSSRSAAGPPSDTWSVCLHGGVGVAFIAADAADAVTGLIGVSVGRTIGRRIEVGSRARLLPGGRRTQIDLMGGGRYLLHFEALPYLTTSLGARFGYVGQDVWLPYRDDSGHEQTTVWSNAVAFQAGGDIRLRLLRRFEVRADLASITMYYYDLWVPAWEPCVGICLYL